LVDHRCSAGGSGTDIGDKREYLRSLPIERAYLLHIRKLPIKSRHTSMYTVSQN